HGLPLLGMTAAALAAALQQPSRLAGVTLLVALGGWWWGSYRLTALDRSPMQAELGRAGRILVAVTSQPRPGRFDIRATGTIRRFGGAAVSEPVQLELPLGRSPPQGAILSALAVVKAPRAPKDGFDERT